MFRLSLRQFHLEQGAGPAMPPPPPTCSGHLLLRLRQPLLPYKSSLFGNNRSVPMVLPQVSPELAARLANYTIDDRARAILRKLAPVLEPRMAEAINEVVTGAERLPQVADTYRKHGADFRRIETAQLQELLKAEFGHG